MKTVITYAFALSAFLVLNGCGEVEDGPVENNNILGIEISTPLNEALSRKVKVKSNTELKFNPHYIGESPYPKGLTERQPFKYIILNQDGYDIFLFARKSDSGFVVHEIHQYPEDAVF